MFWNREEREKKKIAKQKRKEAYDRVYQLHQNSSFLCYIDNAYLEEYQGKQYVKLSGSMALGEGSVSEQYKLYDCTGRFKAEINVEEFYVGNDSVQTIVADDKDVAIYPKQQDISYKAGDLLCKLL